MTHDDHAPDAPTTAEQVATLANLVSSFAEQLSDLRLAVGALRSELSVVRTEIEAYVDAADARIAAASLEGLDSLDTSIGAAREYAETLNERRCRDIDRLDTMIRENNEMLAQLRSDTERRFDDVRRTAGRW